MNRSVLKVKVDEFLARKIGTMVKRGAFKIEEDRERALKLRSWAEVRIIRLVNSVILLFECARGFKKSFKGHMENKGLMCSRFLK
mgnify:CR=1 FL=1|jgi:hypothetical protein